MKTIKFVRLTKASVEAFAGVPLFNQRCVYPVVSESEDDVMIEIHPASGVTNSAKLVVPKGMIEKASASLMELMPQGHYRLSQQLLDCKDLPDTVFNPAMSRDKDCMPYVNPCSSMTDTNAAIIATFPRVSGGGTANIYAPTNWFVLEEQAEAQPPAKKGKTKHPTSDDIGKFVRVTGGSDPALIGRHYGIHSWDKFRAKFSLFNGFAEVRCSPDDIELAPKELLKKGQYVTQSDSWLKTGRSLGGRFGTEELDKQQVVMVVDSCDTFGKCVLTLVNTDLAALAAINACVDDVRLFTDEELKAFNHYRGIGCQRDEAFCRKVLQPVIVKAIDMAPTSKLVADILASWHGIIIPEGVDNVAAVYVHIVKQADKIKVGVDARAVHLSSFMKQPVVEAGNNTIPSDGGTLGVESGLPVAASTEFERFDEVG